MPGDSNLYKQNPQGDNIKSKKNNKNSQRSTFSLSRMLLGAYMVSQIPGVSGASADHRTGDGSALALNVPQVRDVPILNHVNPEQPNHLNGIVPSNSDRDSHVRQPEYVIIPHDDSNSQVSHSEVKVTDSDSGSKKDFAASDEQNLQIEKKDSDIGKHFTTGDKINVQEDINKILSNSDDIEKLENIAIQLCDNLEKAINAIKLVEQHPEGKEAFGHFYKELQKRQNQSDPTHKLQGRQNITLDQIITQIQGQISSIGSTLDDINDYEAKLTIGQNNLNSSIQDVNNTSTKSKRDTNASIENAKTRGNVGIGLGAPALALSLLSLAGTALLLWRDNQRQKDIKQLKLQGQPLTDMPPRASAESTAPIITGNTSSASRGAQRYT